MKTALISGANRGIGLQFCKQLKAKGWRVIGLCRSATEQLNEVADVVVSDVDVTDIPSLKAAASKLSNEKLDLLINNAGILHVEEFPGLDYDSIMRQFEVNTLGPLKTTETFQELLNPEAKVCVITSRMGSISDNSSGGYMGYRISKCAVNAAFTTLAKTGLTVGIFHPGYVQTDMTRNNGNITAEESVTGLLAQVEKLEKSETPKMISFAGDVIEW